MNIHLVRVLNQLKKGTHITRGTMYDCFSGQFFHISEFFLFLFYFVVAMSDLVHDVEAIHIAYVNL